MGKLKSGDEASNEHSDSNLVQFVKNQQENHHISILYRN